MQMRAWPRVLAGACLLVLVTIAGCGGGDAPAERPQGPAESQALFAAVGDPVDVQARLSSGYDSANCLVIGGGLPPGLQVRSDCRIVGTPALPGSFNVQLDVRPAGGSGGVLIVFVDVAGLTMRPDFVQPTLVMLQPAIPWQPVRTDVWGSFALRPADALRFSVVSGSLPPGLVLDPSTGIVSGTPNDLDFFSAEVGITLIRNGTEWPVPVSASNPRSAKNVRLDLRVGAPWNAISYGSTSSFDLSAVAFVSPTPVIVGDFPPGASVSYTASGLPTWLRLDPATGVLFGTPVAAGVDWVRPTATVRLANGKTYDIELAVPVDFLEFEAQPIAPRYPVASNGALLGDTTGLTPRMLTLAAGEAVTVDPGEVVRGLPGDIYAYEVVSVASVLFPLEPSPRPDWVSVHPASGVVTVTPPAGFSGVVSFAIKVTTKRGAISYESLLAWQVNVA